MFHPKELSTLLNLLSEDDKPFETLSTTFHRTFNKPDHFKFGCTLFYMLQDNLLRKPSHRLSAFYILYDLYKGEPLNVNPFLPIFLDTLDRNTNKKGGQTEQDIECNFLSQLLSASLPKHLPKKSPLETLTSHEKTKTSYPDTSTLRKLYLERLDNDTLNTFKKIGISPTIFDPVKSEQTEPENNSNDINNNNSNNNNNSSSSSSNNSDIKSKSSNDIDVSIDELTLHSFYPTIHRPAPPLYQSSHEDQMIWLNPTIQPNVLWDNSMLVSPGKNLQELRDLFVKAMRGPLTPSEHQQIIETLDSDTRLIYHCGLTPKRLPDLVENNPSIAIEVILKLGTSSQVTEYLSVLGTMDMSLHSMEVVNRLTTAVDLPTEYIHLYITHCITSCTLIKDKFLQNRMVRLVCVFLQSLIRNKTLDVKDQYLEIQRFCIEFSKIREAAVLCGGFKALEQSNENKTQYP
eukprot:TRINITY_DN1439_c0_g4_i1.p1 TRINITY_DN1439_c0_g4~~TRINITY_DN1439_c0_g4_i1.p1  ORF type:complete len:460 (-),score=90.73 TRINITY_DN1439_c0_g4_i1:55-1434(-)